MNNIPRNSSNDDDDRWPTSALLMWGVFSTRTPAGRRYVQRCSIALAVLILPTLLFLIHHYPHLHYVPRSRWVSQGTPAFGYATAILLPIVFSYIVLEFRKYLLSLDELARRLQIEAMAWTYLTGLVLMALLCALWLFGLGKVNLAWFCPVWFGLLEPVRAGWLYVLSRRY
jgi:hypothetical protein